MARGGVYPDRQGQQFFRQYNKVADARCAMEISCPDDRPESLNTDAVTARAHLLPKVFIFTWKKMVLIKSSSSSGAAHALSRHVPGLNGRKTANRPLRSTRHAAALLAERKRARRSQRHVAWRAARRAGSTNHQLPDPFQHGHRSSARDHATAAGGRHQQKCKCVRK